MTLTKSMPKCSSNLTIVRTFAPNAWTVPSTIKTIGTANTTHIKQVKMTDYLFNEIYEFECIS